MIGRGGRAQRGYCVIDVILRQRNDIHIPFDDEKARRFRICLLRLIKAVKLTALMENVSFRGVEVLGQGITQHATTKTNHPATLVADREHHPFAEAVVASSLVVGDQHTCVDQRFTIFAIAAKTL